jgi:hypothetical protein
VTRVTVGLNGTVSLAAGVGDDVAVFEPWGPGDVFRSGLREIVALRRVLDALEIELVVSARRRGCGWRDLGEDLGLSAHGVRKRHLAVDPIHAWRSSRRRESDR